MSIGFNIHGSIHGFLMNAIYGYHIDEGAPRSAGMTLLIRTGFDPVCLTSPSE